MKSTLPLCLTTVVLIATTFGPLGVAMAQPDTDLNLAVVAEPSSTYVSGDTSLAALNDGHDPRRSLDNRRGSYGNWPRRGTQWVQYDWSQPISTSKINVYWWDDHRGVRLPRACRLLYWNGTDFVSVQNPSGLGVAGDRYNTTTFEKVTTEKLRLEIDSNDTFSTGILEWKVYDAGDSPDFPPRVEAGVDRTVMLGGKTYLNGSMRALAGKGAAPVVAWSKVSGPGTVRFADAGALTTTATFSVTGNYVLELEARKGPLSASSTLNVTVAAPPEDPHLHLIDTKPYTIDSPLWNSRAKALIVRWIPHCIERISDPNLAGRRHKQLHRRGQQAGGQAARPASRLRLLQRLGLQHDRIDLRRPDGSIRRATRKSSQPKRR